VSRLFIVTLIATIAAMWVQSLARDLWQIRSLPERVMKRVLLFVPLDLFEHGLQQLGPSAKEYALIENMLGMALTLLLIGYVLLRAGVSGAVVLSAAGGLWLLAMLFIVLITGGGFFGTRCSNRRHQVGVTTA
jgi:hypothetical protein